MVKFLRKFKKSKASGEKIPTGPSEKKQVHPARIVAEEETAPISDDVRAPNGTNYRGRTASREQDSNNALTTAATPTAFESFMDYVAFPEKYLFKCSEDGNDVDTENEEHFLNNMGNMLYKQGKLDEALKIYQKSLSIRIKSVGKNHILVADSYNNIGNVLQKQDKSQKALDMYNKSLAIRTKCLKDQNDLSIADTYTNKATALLKLNELFDAQEMYEEALCIREKKLGPDHLSVADTYIDIGLVQEASEDKADAISSFEKAYAIKKKSCKNKSEIADTYKNIDRIIEEYGESANALDDAGDFEEAMEAYEEILAIQKRNLGDSHESVADTYIDIAHILEHQDDPDSALKIYANAAVKMYQDAANIYKKKYGDGHEEVANTLIAMAEVLKNLGRNKEAADLEDRAKTMLQC